MTMDSIPPRNRPVEMAIIFIFIAALFFPLTIWLLQKDTLYSETEKRDLQSFPAITKLHSITEFTKAYDNYFQDHFGMREWLIHRYQRETSKHFGVSGTSIVIEGSNGWFFYSGEHILDDLKGKLRLSRQDESRFWNILKQKTEWLDNQGIKYIFMVAPNKQSIYPEHLSQYYQQKKTISRLDHLLASGSEKESAMIVDVRPQLRKGKSIERLYHKSDTHWNSRGAYLAYLTLMKQVRSLFPDFTPREKFQFMPNWQAGSGGDLSIMINRRKSIIEQRPVIDSRDFTFVKKKLSKKLSTFFYLPQLKPFYSEKKDGQLRVLILHDSFFKPIRPFTSDTFKEALYIWQYYDASTLEFFNQRNLSLLLDFYQPDLVIEETVERFLPRFLTTNRWLEKYGPRPGNKNKE